MSTGCGTSYHFCCARQACPQRGKEPGGTACAGHAQAQGLCAAPLDSLLLRPSTNRSDLQGSLRLTLPSSRGAASVPSQLTTHTLLLLPQHTPGKSCSLLSSYKGCKVIQVAELQHTHRFAMYVLDIYCVRFRWMNLPLLHNKYWCFDLECAAIPTLRPAGHCCFSLTWPSHRDMASFYGSFIFDVCQIISQGSKHRHVKFMFCNCIY